MKIEISEHFNLKKLIKFVFPSIVMMMFTSIYGVVDGFFVSNYAGKTAFAAVNLIMPVLMILGTFGFMIGTGGSALVAKTMGEGNKKKANELFSLLIYSVIIFGIITLIIGQIFIRKISIALGADNEMLEYCVIYSRIALLSITFFMLQNVFQSFFITASKPNLGLYVTVAAGLMNMILDFVFVGIFKWGVAGASAATSISELTGGGIPLLYFFFNKSGNLKLGKPAIDFKALLKACTNGASEMMTNISMSAVNILYNFQLIKYYGENGVAAYGVIMYVNFVFVSIFIGYSIGVAPIVSFNYGAKNSFELKNIFKKSNWFILISGTSLFALALIFAGLVSKIFTGYDESLFKLTKYAFQLIALNYIFCGFNIFSSSFFTALNNGAVSAIISFSRMLLFQCPAVMLIPLIFGYKYIWISLTIAEFLTLIMTIYFYITRKKKYEYM